MISCDECQKKIVAVFDNEGSEGDEELVSTHLKDCPECRAFHEDMVRIRQRFVSVPVPSLPPAVGQELMRQAEADYLRSKRLRRHKSVRREPLLVRFPRLAWAGGLAAVFLIVSSSLVCFILARQVGDLRQDLQAARQEVAADRAERLLKEAQEREEKAIAALYFRMQELEERVELFSSPRTTFLPTELNSFSDRPGQM